MKLCKEYEIKVENYHAPFSHINDMWFDIPEGEEMLKELTDGVDNCKKYGVDTLIVHLSGGRAPITEIGISRFEKLLALAKENGVTIAFENLSRLGNLAYAFEEFEDAGFCWDTGHEKAFTHGRQYMPLYSDKIAALHVHDNFCVHKEDLHMIPFDANVDFDRVTTQLAEANYSKSLMLEVMAHRTQKYIDMGSDEFYKKAADAAKKLAADVERKKL
jgi:sugar phosphate isomerase/epimerase